MPYLQCRGSISLAAVAVALLWSGRADAQAGHYPGQWGSTNPVVIGTVVEIVDQAKAERRLDHLEAKIARDTERGNPAAVERDAWRITRTRYRIVVDEWLLRKNSLCDPGPYPWPLRMDCMTQATMASVRRPPQAPGSLIMPDYSIR